MSNLFLSPMSSGKNRGAEPPGRLIPKEPSNLGLPGPQPAEAPVMRSHHARRIEAVLDHIQQHLSDDLSLEALAERAAISPFHFHRLFQAWTGETLNRCVRRLRLESAAGRLRHCPAEKITVISLNCGFASPEAFARAFREHFGMTPSQWRTGGWSSWRHVANEPWPPLPCRIEVKRHDEAEFLFMRARGHYAGTCADLWGRFLPWVHRMGLGDQPLICIGLDDPAITEPALCRMDACVQVPTAWQDSGLRLPRHRFPARWVATLHYDGPADDIGRGWHTLLNDWLPHAPFDMGEGHFFQRYDPREGVPDSQLVRCELCMPVQPRAS
jgi:AraC family transcriptional regulator